MLSCGPSKAHPTARPGALEAHHGSHHQGKRVLRVEPGLPEDLAVAELAIEIAARLAPPRLVAHAAGRVVVDDRHPVSARPLGEHLLRNAHHRGDDALVAVAQRRILRHHTHRHPPTHAPSAHCSVEHRRPHRARRPPRAPSPGPGEGGRARESCGLERTRAATREFEQARVRAAAQHRRLPVDGSIWAASPAGVVRKCPTLLVTRWPA